MALSKHTRTIHQSFEKPYKTPQKFHFSLPKRPARVSATERLRLLFEAKKKNYQHQSGRRRRARHSHHTSADNGGTLSFRHAQTEDILAMRSTPISPWKTLKTHQHGHLQNKIVWIVVGNAGMVDLMHNFVCNARLLGSTNWVIGPLDKEMHDVALQEGWPTMNFSQYESFVRDMEIDDLTKLMEQNNANEDDMNQRHKFGTESYMILTRLKWLPAMIGLHLGYHVFLTDVDIVFFHDPFQANNGELLDLAEKYHFVGATESLKRWTLNAGYWIAHPLVMNIFRARQDEGKSFTEVNNQFWLNSQFSCQIRKSRGKRGQIKVQAMQRFCEFPDARPPYCGFSTCDLQFPVPTQIRRHLLKTNSRNAEPSSGRPEETKHVLVRLKYFYLDPDVHSCGNAQLSLKKDWDRGIWTDHVVTKANAAAGKDRVSMHLNFLRYQQHKFDVLTNNGWWFYDYKSGECVDVHGEDDDGIVRMNGESNDHR